LSTQTRLTQSVPNGPRLHVIHLSLRDRDAHRQFGGSTLLDLGPGQIGVPVDVPEPASFDFGEVSRHHLAQATAGLAYDGRWRNVGEISFSISKTHYRKTTDIPGDDPVVSRSNPWLYNGTAAVNLSKAIAVYAGYARGPEERGVAPRDAANTNTTRAAHRTADTRTTPLPTSITTQKAAGVRIAVGGLKIVGGVFGLTRPYFGFNSEKFFGAVGTRESPARRS